MKEWEINPLLLRLLMVRLAKNHESRFDEIKAEDEKTKRNDKANDNWGNSGSAPFIFTLTHLLIHPSTLPHSDEGPV